MTVDWDEVNKAFSPIKGYADMRQRLRVSFGYEFVRQAYNFSIPEVAGYTRRLLGGDARGRYTDYLTLLVRLIAELQRAGVSDVLDLAGRVETLAQFENFILQSGIPALDLAAVLKYLIYWVIPMEKYLSGLVRDDDQTTLQAIQTLREIGIRTNLELLQKGISPTGRRALIDSSGLAEAVVAGLINRADFSRLPWASKATISNIIGAGYGSLAQLAAADPQQLYADFFRYGEAIGKNLKLGNEIENSYRIAKIVPSIVQNN
jgi:hypothetical protein